MGHLLHKRYKVQWLFTRECYCTSADLQHRWHNVRNFKYLLTIPFCNKKKTSKIFEFSNVSTLVEQYRFGFGNHSNDFIRTDCNQTSNEQALYLSALLSQYDLYHFVFLQCCDNSFFPDAKDKKGCVS